MNDNLTAQEQKLSDVANVLATMKVTVPESRSGNIEIKKLEITGPMVLRETQYLTRVREYTPPGMYTAMYIDGNLWMSDTLAERFDHLWFLNKIVKEKSENILITGLGLGMILEGIIRLAPSVKRVTAFENNQDVIATSGHYYHARMREAGIKFEIVDVDAAMYHTYHDQRPRYDAVWHDIWIDAGEHMVAEYAAMKDRYSPLVNPGGFQMCWGEQIIEDQESYEDMMMDMYKIMRGSYVIDQEN